MIPFDHTTTAALLRPTQEACCLRWPHSLPPYGPDCDRRIAPAIAADFRADPERALSHLTAEDLSAILAEVGHWPEWMRLDAQTILDAMSQGWPVAEWHHEQDAREKLERILRLLANPPRP